ncbi:MAG: ATP-binding cassette domain-containing protein [Thermodesulforhabdaceae bacterium]
MPVTIVKPLEVVKQGRTILSVERFVLREGEKVCLFGPNGAGKSTFLRNLALIDSNHKGSVFYRKVSTKEIGYLMQEPYFFRGSVADNLALPLKIRGWSKREINEKVHHIATLYKIERLLPLSPFKLSGGEKQKVNLLRTFIYEPVFLYLDEPFTGLDAPGKRELTDYLLDYLEEDRRRSVIYTSHNVYEMIDWGERFVYLRDGRIVFDMGRDEFMELADQELDDPYLRAFLAPMHRRFRDGSQTACVDRRKRQGDIW